MLRFKPMPPTKHATLKTRTRLAKRNKAYDRKLRKELREDYGSHVVNLNTH